MINKKKIENKRDYLTALLIFIFSMIIFLSANFHQEFLGMEARWALFVKYMHDTGPVFFPTIFGHPYPDYPGLFTMLSYWLTFIFGSLNMFTLNFPTAFCAGITVMFTYLIGTLHSKRTGLYAALLLLGTVHFVQSARTPNPDFMVAALTTIIFYFSYKSIYTEKGKAYIWIFPLCIVGGFFFRGPIGLIVPASVICLMFLFDRRIKRFVIFAVESGILLTLLSYLNYKLAELQGGIEFAHTVVVAQFLGRMEAYKSFFYYFGGAFGGYSIAYSIAIICIIIFARKHYLKKRTFKSGELHLYKNCIIWFLIIFIGLSVPGSKHLRYVLAGIPAVSIIAAYFFNEKYVTDGIHRIIRMIVNFILLISPLLSAIAVLIGYYVVSKVEIPAKYQIQYNVIVPVIILLIFSVIVLLFLVRTKLWKNQLFILFVGVITFFVLNISFIEPLQRGLESSSKFVNAVETVRDKHNNPIVFYDLGPDGDDLNFIVMMKKPVVPIFITEPSEMPAYSKPYIILISDKNYRRLPELYKTKTTILVNGLLGRDLCHAIEYN